MTLSQVKAFNLLPGHKVINVTSESVGMSEVYTVVENYGVVGRSSRFRALVKIKFDLNGFDVIVTSEWDNYYTVLNNSEQLPRPMRHTKGVRGAKGKR